MNKFKVGDKVRYIETSIGEICRDSIYTVRKLRPFMNSVGWGIQTVPLDGVHLEEFPPKESGYDPFWYESRFELVEPVSRYFINPTGFKDETSYIVLTGDIFTTVRPNGDIGRSFKIDEMYKRIINEGDWKEVSKEEALADSKVILKEWLVENTSRKDFFLFWSSSDPSDSNVRAIFTGNTRTISKKGVPCA